METDARAGELKEGGWVRILRGSEAEARHLRKYGHGEPWKYRYSVKKRTKHAVLLEVPKDGSVPAIMEWQLIRRCEPAPEKVHERHHDDPKLTEFGIPTNEDGDTTGSPIGMPTDPDDPDHFWEIEYVIANKRVRREAQFCCIARVRQHEEYRSPRRRGRDWYLPCQ